MIFVRLSKVKLMQVDGGKMLFLIEGGVFFNSGAVAIGSIKFYFMVVWECESPLQLKLCYCLIDGISDGFCLDGDGDADDVLIFILGVDNIFFDTF